MAPTFEGIRRQARCLIDSSQCTNNLSKRDSANHDVNLKVLIPVLILLLIAAFIIFNFLFRRDPRKRHGDDDNGPTKTDPVNQTYIEMYPHPQDVAGQNNQGRTDGFVPDYGMSLDRSGAAGFDALGVRSRRDDLGKPPPPPWDPTAPDGKLSAEESGLVSPPPVYSRK